MCNPEGINFCFVKFSVSTYLHGRKILTVFDTWSRQNGHRETAEEHLRQRTWPQGIIVTSTSAVKQTRQSHAAFAVSASFDASSAFSCNFYPPQEELVGELSNCRPEVTVIRKELRIKKVGEMISELLTMTCFVYTDMSTLKMPIYTFTFWFMTVDIK